MEEIGGIKIFTDLLEFYRYIQSFEGTRPSKEDEGIRITARKHVFYYGDLIALFTNN